MWTCTVTVYSETCRIQMFGQFDFYFMHCWEIGQAWLQTTANTICNKGYFNLILIKCQLMCLWVALQIKLEGIVINYTLTVIWIYHGITNTKVTVIESRRGGGKYKL